MFADVCPFSMCSQGVLALTQNSPTRLNWIRGIVIFGMFSYFVQILNWWIGFAFVKRSATENYLRPATLPIYKFNKKKKITIFAGAEAYQMLTLNISTWKRSSTPSKHKKRKLAISHSTLGKSQWNWFAVVLGGCTCSTWFLSVAIARPSQMQAKSKIKGILINFRFTFFRVQRMAHSHSSVH